MAKFDFKQFMLEKGERVVLGGCLAGLGLFGVLGIMHTVSAESPTATTTALKSGAKNVDSAFNNQGGTAPPLPAWVVDTKSFHQIDPKTFEVRESFFEPVDFPSKLRENPKVLGITAAQLDLVRAPMKAYDIKVMPDGTRLIGILSSRVKTSATDAKTIKDMLTTSAISDRINKKRPPRAGPQTPPPGGPMGAGGPMGGGPGRGMGTGGPPPGMGGMGSGGMGGEIGGTYGASDGSNYNQGGDRYEHMVTYIPVDEFDKKTAPIPAFTVFPVRMVVVHASFPLKEQLEEIRRALRLHSVEEARRESIPAVPGVTSGGVLGSVTPPPPAAFAGANPMGPGAMLGGSAGDPGGPVFAGFEVERKVTTPPPSAQTYDWEPYNHEEKYVEDIWSRKIGDQADDGYLSYFLRYDQMMAMPLPALSDGLALSYPKVNLPPIVAAVEKMKELRKQPVVPSEWQKRFGGKKSDGSNPFLPQAMGTGTGTGGGAGAGGFLSDSGSAPGVGSGMGGFGRSGGGMPPMGSPMGGGSDRPGGPMGPGYGRSGPMGPGNYPPGSYPPGQMFVQTDSPERDHLLIRFFDTEIKPGFTYQYRIRVKLKNPNYFRKDVGRPDDAKQEILYGDWVSIRDKVTVTSELNLYAADPVKYADKVREKYKDQAVINLLDNKDGKQPVVQIQQWMREVGIDTNKREPVGVWVIGDIPVNRGEYIGKRQLVSLPMWSAEKGTYLLQELPKYKVWKAREQPKGVLVDFSTKFLLVDYEGGRVRTQIGDRGLDDEAATEMLILRPDGSVVIHNSATDMADKDRLDRQQKWDDWLKAVTDITQRVGPQTSGGSDGPGFQRGGGNN